MSITIGTSEMRRGVVAALDLETHKGALVDSSETIIRRFSLPHYSDREDISSYAVRVVSEICGAQPLAIGISTKGNPYNPSSESRKTKISYPVKAFPEHGRSGTSLPVAVLNRFHAFALGVCDDLEHPAYGVINLASGTGYGVVRSGVVLEQYDETGAGGLRRVERRSTGEREAIAGIAGQTALSSRGKCSVKELFRRATAEDAIAKSILLDATDAAAELVVALVQKFHVYDVTMKVYESEALSEAESDRFLMRTQEAVRKKLPGMNISLRLIRHIGEQDAKLLGAARRAFQEIQRPATDRLPKVFAITGKPASGKTTFLNEKLLSRLRTEGVRVAGMFCKEIRNTEKRTGFSVSVFSSTQPQSEPIELAVVRGSEEEKADLSIYRPFGGLYQSFWVNVRNIDQVVVPRLREMWKTADIMLIDEIGGMQLLCPAFKGLIREILASNTPLVVTIPQISRNPLVNEIREKTEASRTLVELSETHRESSQAAAEKDLLPAMLSLVKRGK
ncbi:MAG: hypothetical protein FJZ63_00365 [Chlamydiae bacterium]|nr:hypothetical protein [Chlamydiota bacterium]